MKAVVAEADKASLQTLGLRQVNKAALIRLGVVFLLSGASSLLYQVGWQRLLTINYGVGPVSVTLIVSMYMLGLGLGALAGGALAQRYAGKSVLIYCLCEALLGLFGLASIPILQWLGHSTSSASFGVYCLCICAFLSLPTILMGMTLPLLTETLTRLDNSFTSVVSTLYAVNTYGAALGAIFGAYVLISFLGLDFAVYTAVAINLLLAASVYFALPKFKSDNQSDQVNITPAKTTKEPDIPLGTKVYLWVFATGFVAIGLEIVWFRTIEIIVKSSPYAFATVLGIYLTGIALGSWFINDFLKIRPDTNRPRLYFGLQCAISVYVMLTYVLLVTYPVKKLIALSNTQELHPALTINIFESISAFQNGWFAYFDILLWPTIFMLVPTILMGASFPLISSITHRAGSNSGKTVGTVYFFTITGNVMGGIITGFVLLQYIGTAMTVLALCLIGLTVFSWPMIASITHKKHKFIFALLLLLPLIALTRYPSSTALIKALHPDAGKDFNCYVQESSSCIDLAYNKDETVWHFINGLAHGGRLPHMYGYAVRAIDSLCCAKKHENILVIGYGTGTIVETVLRTPTVKSVTMVELNEAVMVNLKKMPLFRKLLADNRIHVVIDDGRRYLNSVNTKYDVVLMDPLRSSTAYSNNIYSREFFEIIKAHLNEGGVLMVWLDNLDVIPKTLTTVFKHMRLDHSFCIVSDSELNLEQSLKNEMLKTYTTEEQKLLSVNEHYLGDETYVKEATRNYPINTDLKPVTEYHLGQLLHARHK
jgi:spermidine synthase